jgi:hypothetical protein
MSANSHTPGPWKYGHAGFGFWVGPDWDQPHVCIVGDRSRETDAPNRENAALIAAAPDLLAACRLLLSSAHDYQTGIADAEAAIAKAEGRP